MGKREEGEDEIQRRGRKEREKKRGEGTGGKYEPLRERKKDKTRGKKEGGKENTKIRRQKVTKRKEIHEEEDVG